jgi:SAM-dependent methyltransferase
VTADAFDAFERQGWRRGRASPYHRGLGPLTSQAVGALLDAARVGRGAAVLDVASGPGYAAAQAAARGADVTAVDVSPEMVELAASLHPGVRFEVGEAGALPFADASFDAVVACLVFEHIEDVDDAIAEVSRVLQTRGRFLFFLNHPLLQTPNSGWIDDTILEEQYWRIGPYLTEDLSIEEVEKDVFIPFIHRPLSRYVNALSKNGLLITHMEEPAPPPGFLERAHEYAEAATIPRLLLLRTEKTDTER